MELKRKVHEQKSELFKNSRLFPQFVGRQKSTVKTKRLEPEASGHMVFTIDFRPPLFEGVRPIKTECFEKVPSGAPRPRIDLNTAKNNR